MCMTATVCQSFSSNLAIITMSQVYIFYYTEKAKQLRVYSVVMCLEYFIAIVVIDKIKLYAPFF